MTIDWITVSAQIINFLILVWLLKRFLYQPVVDAMERREQQIAERLADVRTRETNAENLRQRYLDAQKELDRNRSQLLDQARTEVAGHKEQLLGDVREEVADARNQWRAQVEVEKAQFLERLRVRATQTVQSMASRALADMADTELENQMIESFVRKLVTLDEHELNFLRVATEPIRILTTFEMDTPAKDRLTHVLRVNLGDATNMQYETTPELLCGIQLTIGGFKLGWNLADYFDRVADQVGEVLDGTGSGRA